MPFNMSKSFLGYEFTMQFCSSFGGDGIIIPPKTKLTHEFISALTMANEFYNHYNPYAELFHIQYRTNEINAPYEHRLRYINLARQALEDVYMLNIVWSDKDIVLFQDIINVLHTPPPAPKKEKVKRQGYIYIIEGAGKQYKIGKSKTPKKRIEKLGVNLPFPIEVIHLIPSNDYDNAEYYLHTKFSHLRGRGEWFNLEDAHIDFIKSIDSLDTKDMQS